MQLDSKEEGNERRRAKVCIQLLLTDSILHPQDLSFSYSEFKHGAFIFFKILLHFTFMQFKILNELPRGRRRVGVEEFQRVLI